MRFDNIVWKLRYESALFYSIWSRLLGAKILSNAATIVVYACIYSQSRE